MKKLLILALVLLVSQSIFAQKKTIDLTEAEFLAKVHDFKSHTDFKYKGDKPAIIDFYADWCGPCRVIAPHLEKVAAQYDGKIYVYKVNVDNNRAVAQAFGVSGIPMVLFVPLDGAPVKSVGARQESDYFNAVRDVLKVQ